MRWGIDSRHGPHQVAQKSRRMTFPFKVERDISWPSIVLRVKSGASPSTFVFLPHWSNPNPRVRIRERIKNIFE